MRRAMAAIAQAAADAARSALPRLRRATAVIAEELDASRAPPDHAPSRPAGSHPEPAGPETARAPVTPLAERISAIVAGVVGAIRRQSWCLSWPLSWWRSWWRAWRVSWWRSSWRSWLLSWRHSWWLWRPSLSRVQCQSWRQAAVFCGIGGHVVGLFASRYSIGTRPASFSQQIDLTLCPAQPGRWAGYIVKCRHPTVFRPLKIFAGPHTQDFKSASELSKPMSALCR